MPTAKVTPDDPAHKFARALLNSPAGVLEDNIRQNIVRLLDALGVESFLSYRTTDGIADIYLPQRRTLIEVKQVGMAVPHKARGRAETPQEQLERYIQAEIKRDLAQFAFEDSTREWTGILTDGQTWRFWRYGHEERALGRESPPHLSPKDGSDGLIGRLQDVLAGEKVGKPWVPESLMPVFAAPLTELRRVYESLSGTALRTTRTKVALWQDKLRMASMEPESPNARDRLFVAHSSLVVLAKGIIHSLSASGVRPRAGTVLNDGFASWVMATMGGRKWAQSLLDKVHAYEWRRRPGDLLRPLYEQLVGAADRRVFGEFYTPDWLAELMVEEILDDAWREEAALDALNALQSGGSLERRGVLDPACGSGTFLYHAARRILGAQALRDVHSGRQADVAASLVHGIDVHPVAAEIARATLLRALPAEPRDGSSALRIYEGDSLLLRSDDEQSLFRPANGEVQVRTPNGRDISLPKSLVDRHDFADLLRRMVAAAAKESALPPDIRSAVPEAEQHDLAACHETLIDIIRTEGNSVWTWYIANIAGPYRLSQCKVDRIVANPPWVKMADIQAQARKREMEDFATTLDLWTGGKQAPHFDIAQLFLRRCRELYLNAPSSDPAGWLVKASALTGGNWGRFREWHQNVLAQSVDLIALQPFGGGDARRCCLLFEGRLSGLSTSVALKAEISPGRRRPKPHEALRDVIDHLRFAEAPRRLPQAASAYVDDRGNVPFRQGATIVPEVLLVTRDASPTSRTGIAIDVQTVASQKAPWRDVPPQLGKVPTHWVHPLIKSEDLLPFVVLPDRQSAIIPMDEDGRLLAVPDEHSAFWADNESIYAELKGRGRSTPQSLATQINYAHKLSSQLPLVPRKAKTLVLYPVAGDLMRAARTQPGSAVVGHTLYYLAASSAREAAYLVALLNAPILGRAFEQARESGRHFSAHPWRKIPIPRFDASDPRHLRLANACVRGERLAAQASRSWNDPTIRQVSASKRLRSLFENAGLNSELNAAAAALLPNHAIP